MPDEIKQTEQQLKTAEQKLERQIERVQNVSSVSAALMKMQKKPEVIVKEDIDSKEDTKVIIGSLNFAMKNLARASVSLADGAKRITIESAKGIRNLSISGSRAIVDASGQYAKAIGEDINVNRQNLMVMSIGKISPVVGYATAKLFETEVFKDMTQNVKTKLGDSISAVGHKFKDIASQGFEKSKEAVTSIVDRVKGADRQPKERIKEAKTTAGAAKQALSEKLESVLSDADSNKEVKQKIEAIEKKIPHLQEGGLVTKTGIIKAHAGELVAPVKNVTDTLLEALNRNIDKRGMQEEDYSTQFRLSPAQKANQSMLASIKDAIILTEKRQYGLQEKIFYKQEQEKSRNPLKTFVNMYKQEAQTHQRPWQERLLREMVLVKLGIYGKQQDLMKVAWEKTLLEHPVLRYLTTATKKIAKGMFVGITFPFRKRGGYEGDVPTGGQALETSAQILGLTYAGQMYRLDQMIAESKRSAEGIDAISTHFTGDERQKEKDVVRKQWTIFQKGLRGIAAPIEWAVKKTLPEKLSEALTKKRTKKGALIDIVTNSTNMMSKLLFGIDIKEILKNKAEAESETEDRQLTIQELLQGIHDHTELLAQYAGVGVGAGAGTIEGKAAEAITPYTQNKINEIKERISLEQYHREKGEEETPKKKTKIWEDFKFAFKQVEAEKTAKEGKDRKKSWKYLSEIASRKDPFPTFRKMLGLQKKQSKTMGFISKYTKKMMSGIRRLRFGLGKKLRGIGSSLMTFGLMIMGVIKTSIGWLLTPLKAVRRLMGTLVMAFARGGLGGLIRSGIPALMKLISPMIPAIISVALPAIALAGAAYAGAKIGGYAWNKWIKPIVDSNFKEMMGKADKSRMKGDVSMQDKAKDIASGKLTREQEAKNIQEIKMKKSMAMGHDVKMASLRRVKMDADPEEYQAVTQAQREYMGRRIGDYLPYGYAQVDEMRQKWIRIGNMDDMDWLDRPEDYGIRREKTFLEFLKKHGKPIGEKQMMKQSFDLAEKQSMYGVKTDFQKKVIAAKDKGKEIIEDVKGKAGAAKDMAKEKFDETKLIAEANYREAYEQAMFFKGRLAKGSKEKYKAWMKTAERWKEKAGIKEKISGVESQGKTALIDIRERANIHKARAEAYIDASGTKVQEQYQDAKVKVAQVGAAGEQRVVDMWERQIKANEKIAENTSADTKNIVTSMSNIVDKSVKSITQSSQTNNNSGGGRSKSMTHHPEIAELTSASHN